MKPQASLLARFGGGLLLAAMLAPLAYSNPDFSGRWKFDPEHSTALDPWSTMEITMAVEGDEVSIVRRYGGDKRNATESMALDLTQPSQVVSTEGWWDNRHIGAYLGDDLQQTVAARWLDGGRTLQLNIDLVLETAQGDTPVRILREMRLSRDGQTLRVFQLRSSRNLPIVRVFRRQ